MRGGIPKAPSYIEDLKVVDVDAECMGGWGLFEGEGDNDKFCSCIVSWCCSNMIGKDSSSSMVDGWYVLSVLVVGQKGVIER